MPALVAPKLRLELGQRIRMERQHKGCGGAVTSGNQLGVSWPKTFSTDDQYDVRAIEVVRSTGDLAWQMDVVGVKCDDASGTCDRGVCQCFQTFRFAALDSDAT